MPHDHIIVDDDNRFSIDTESREITNVSGNGPVLMQEDHNSERFTFEMPRFIEGHDVCECDLVEIKFQNTGSGTSISTRATSSDRYTVTDIKVDPENPDKVIFSWLVGKRATMYAGNLSFQIRFSCVEDPVEGTYAFAWHTNKYVKVTIRAGIDTDSSIKEEYPDVLDSLRDSVIALDERIDELDDQMDDLMYKPITITSFTNDVKLKYFGKTVETVNLSWAFSKTPVSVALYGKNSTLISNTLSPNSTGTTLSDCNYNEYISWTLKATDERGAVASKTTSITFVHSVYYGVGDARDSYDSDFVNSLTDDWRTDKLSSVTLSPNAQHIYYCLPTWMGECSFSVGVLPGGFELADTISVTNEHGGTEDYYIYRSVEALSGTVTVNIS